MSIDEEKAATAAEPQEGAPGGPGTPAADAPAPGIASGAASPNGALGAAPKKPRRRGWIVAGVVAAVIVVAGAGFWVWHEQPSFCNAICHSPMDYYVETYDDDNPQLGVTAHAKAGEACLDCHTAELTTQVAEVCTWVSDTYPMTEDGTMLATGKQFASEEFCARPECHHAAGTSFDEITANLWGFAGNDEKYNPHASHQDMALECGDCHKIHENQVLVRNECHDLTLPEGWEAPMQSNVSRRSFFKGAGLAALGGLSAAALSGCGHGYAAEEPANLSTGDFGGPSWLGAPPVIEESEIAETIDTEVLVVGIGTGCIPAMISSAENGARVLGIDRQGSPHNVREDIGVIDSRLQQASFDEFPQFRIDKMEAMEEIVRYANGFVDYDLVKLWANESGAMVDWLTDIVERDGKMVMEFEGGVGNINDPGRDKAFATGHSPQKTDAVGEDEEWGSAESILAYAAEQGAEVRWYTEFVKCETDEGGPR